MEPEPVSMVSPPSLREVKSVADSNIKKRTRQRKPKVDNNTIGTRRSARLLKGKTKI